MLRDRDAIITREGIIFRVYGYTHPKEGYVCDVEYAPSNIFQSTIPKAFRKGISNRTYYKFFEDEGLRFIRKNYPQYQIFYEPLQEKVVGVEENHITEIRKPEDKLRELVNWNPRDLLHEATLKVLRVVTDSTGLKFEDFGVFGSMLHGFYHPEFSDIDLIIYGKPQLAKLRSFLGEAYQLQDSALRNEFETCKAIEGKVWRFHNISAKEFLWHQKRKLIYGVFKDEKSGRIIKTEFEPVKEWKEIQGERSQKMRIKRLGWIKATLRVTDDSEAAFMPAVYKVEPLNLLVNAEKRIDHVEQVVSYVEEFRMQAFRDEIVYVEGNLEQITMPSKVFHQITLTRCPRYYEQVMKKVR